MDLRGILKTTGVTSKEAFTSVPIKQAALGNDPTGKIQIGIGFMCVQVKYHNHNKLIICIDFIMRCSIILLK